MTPLHALLLLVVAAIGVDAVAPLACTGNAVYRVRFEGQWQSNVGDAHRKACSCSRRCTFLLSSPLNRAAASPTSSSCPRLFL
jgi:hypothetical protein